MSNPYQSSQFAPISPLQAPQFDREKLRRVARYQQWTIYALLVNVVINIVAISVREAGSLVNLGVLAIALAGVVFAIVAIALLASELYGTGIAVLCGILMLVPCVSLITLLIVNGKATSFLQSQGVKVGFMGVNPDTI